MQEIWYPIYYYLFRNVTILQVIKLLNSAFIFTHTLYVVIERQSKFIGFIKKVGELTNDIISTKWQVPCLRHFGFIFSTVEGKRNELLIICILSRFRHTHVHLWDVTKTQGALWCLFYMCRYTKVWFLSSLSSLNCILFTLTHISKKQLSWWRSEDKSMEIPPSSPQHLVGIAHPGTHLTICWSLIIHFYGQIGV